VQPLGEGAWNEKGLAFYDRLVDGLLARGIAPHLTLNHWDLPQALQDKGGWASRDTVHRFVDYAWASSAAWATGWPITTHNEPWVHRGAGPRGRHVRAGHQETRRSRQVAHHLLLSHGLALQAMRAEGAGQAGHRAEPVAHQRGHRQRGRPGQGRHRDASFVRWYMEPIFQGAYPQDAGIAHYPRNIEAGDFAVIGQPLDFLGVNYYTRIWASTASRACRRPTRWASPTWAGRSTPKASRELLVGLHRATPACRRST
jgi:beta-glucosidase